MKSFCKSATQNIIGIFLFLAALCSFAAGQNVRVMTFNIRYATPNDGVNAWENRKQKVADVIRFHKADIAGLQEALIGQIDYLQQKLPNFKLCGVGRDDGKNSGEFSAILFRKDRFEMKECKTFWLSETPDVPGSKGWGANFARIVTYAKFYDRKTKKTFYHFNTHFDHESKKARLESAKMILRKVNEVFENNSFVVTGDFNLTESEEPYAILTGKNSKEKMRFLKDARYESINGHFGGNSTFTGFKMPQPDRRIDYIFVKSGTKVFEHGILTDSWDGFWASDHFPVIAEIAF